jgi:hypothetical protein
MCSLLFVLLNLCLNFEKPFPPLTEAVLENTFHVGNFLACRLCHDWYMNVEICYKNRVPSSKHQYLKECGSFTSREGREGGRDIRY